MARLFLLLGKRAAIFKLLEDDLLVVCCSSGCKVHLFKSVKVRENGINDPERYRNWGLEFDA